MTICGHLYFLKLKNSSRQIFSNTLLLVNSCPCVLKEKIVEYQSQNAKRRKSARILGKQQTYAPSTEVRIHGFFLLFVSVFTETVLNLS